MFSRIAGYDPTPSKPGSYFKLHTHRPIPWNQPLPYIEGLLFKDFGNVTLTSQLLCQHNNKFDCSEHSTINVVKKEDAIAIFYGKNKLYFSC